MNIFKRTNAKREVDAGTRTSEAPKEQPKEKSGGKTMSYQDFFYPEKKSKPEKKYAKGGTVSRGYGMARSGKKCKMV